MKRVGAVFGVTCALAATAYGCGSGSADVGGGVVDGPEPSEHLGQTSAALGGTVQDQVNSSCTTLSVLGLSKQIVDEVNCLIPNALAPVPDEPNLVKSSTTFAFLQPAAKDALVKVLALNPGMTLNVNSMLRNVVQQYLLYAWYQAGKCGIPLAATPGTSNHEQGPAFDTSDYNAWMGSLDSTASSGSAARTWCTSTTWAPARSA